MAHQVGGARQSVCAKLGLPDEGARGTKRPAMGSKMSCANMVVVCNKMNFYFGRNAVASVRSVPLWQNPGFIPENRS